MKAEREVHAILSSYYKRPISGMSPKIDDKSNSQSGVNFDY